MVNSVLQPLASLHIGTELGPGDHEQTSPGAMGLESSGGNSRRDTHEPINHTTLGVSIAVSAAGLE